MGGPGLVGTHMATVIPAQAGILSPDVFWEAIGKPVWIPARAGMTDSVGTA